MELVAKTREITGKKVRTLRREGLVPAELYGHGLANVHLSVPVKEFTKVFKEAGENTVVTLVVGADKKSAIIHDVQKNYLTGAFDHVDFYQVRMDELLAAKIPLEFTGESPAVREKGGIVAKAMSELEVEALPNDLPHRIVVDLSVLDELNKTIYVRDLVIGKGVTVLVDAETPVVSVTPPRAEEEVVEAPVDLTAVKVESEEKKAERAEAKAEKKEE